MQDVVRNSNVELDKHHASTPRNRHIFRDLEHTKDERESEVVSALQSLPTTNPYLFPSNVGALSGKISSASHSVIAQKQSNFQALQRHSNPATSHVSTAHALFTPSKTLVKEADFGESSSKNVETAVASPSGLVVPVPNSLGLFDRMRLQARLHSESADIAPSEYAPQKHTHTSSRLSTFLGASQVSVSPAAFKNRLQEPSTLVERKLAILGDLRDAEKVAEYDPIQASELWQQARAEQRMLRNRQISGDFEERWKNINDIRDSMFKNGDAQYSGSRLSAEISSSAKGESSSMHSRQNIPAQANIEHSLVASESGFRSRQVPVLHSPLLSKGFSQLFADAQNPTPNPAQLQSTDSSVRSSVATPKRRLGQLASDQDLGDSALKMSDLRQSFPSTIYNRL